MAETVLKIEEVSKLYRLGQVGTGMLLNDMNRWWKKQIGKPDTYAKIGEENDRTKKGGEFAWALQDISFDVKRGDVIGLIGRNGAGKSTLLKILSKVTSPTAGKIYIKGSMVSLLEVGTGFHPELTGRENIYLNAAILGMKKAEVNKKLDAIVDFAGVAKYLDTPVKRYSSGMKVRLGFAVAAHLEPDILIVDEVLAVGDAEFQNKAIGKMQEVSQGEGRTVIFVSHNMASIKKLCNTGLVLDKGKLTYSGNINDAINVYFNQFNVAGEIFSNQVTLDPDMDSGEIRLLSASVRTKEISESVIFPSTDEIELEINYKVINPVLGMRMNFQVQSFDSSVLFAFSSHDKEPAEKLPGNYSIKLKIPGRILNEGKYFICVQSGIPNERELLSNRRVIGFEIVKTSNTGSRLNERFPGYFSLDLALEMSKND